MDGDLARLEHDFAAEPGGYFKVERVVPAEELRPLRATFGPLEPKAMLDAVHILIRFYQEHAARLAAQYEISYPAEVERVLSRRLEQLSTNDETG